MLKDFSIVDSSTFKNLIHSNSIVTVSLVLDKLGHGSKNDQAVTGHLITGDQTTGLQGYRRKRSGGGTIFM